MAAALVSLSAGGCDPATNEDKPATTSGAEPTTSAPISTSGAGPTTSAAEVKVASALVQAASRVQAARAQSASADLAGLSDGLVHVRADGAVEVVIHSRFVVGADQLAGLRSLGAEVVDVSVTPAAAGGAPSASLVQAWIPASQLAAVGALEWVAALTPPAYPPSGG